MRGLALLPTLLLAACDLEPSAARNVLKDEGLTHIEVSPIGVFDRPCQWSEVFASRFVAKRDNRRVSGVICAVGEGGQSAVLRGAFDVDKRWILRGAR